jgi:hypothetical protein
MDKAKITGYAHPLKSGRVSLKPHHFTAKGGCENWFMDQLKATEFMDICNNYVLILYSFSSGVVYRHHFCSPPLHLLATDIVLSAFSCCCCCILLAEI